MLTFFLWNVPGISLLVPAKSGCLYATQTGGHWCQERSIEAVLFPLFNTYGSVDQEQMLHRHFVLKFGGWGGYGQTADSLEIDLATADYIDQVLGDTPHTDWLRVDRNRLAESHEAWVHVVPVKIRDTETIDFGTFRFDTAVITWPNSD